MASVEFRISGLECIGGSHTHCMTLTLNFRASSSKAPHLEVEPSEKASRNLLSLCFDVHSHMSRLILSTLLEVIPWLLALSAGNGDSLQEVLLNRFLEGSNERLLS